MKLLLLSGFAALWAVFALPSLRAQTPAGHATRMPPPPPPRLPSVDPPVDHPAYLAQPLMQRQSDPTPEPAPDARRKSGDFVPPAGPLPPPPPAAAGRKDPADPGPAGRPVRPDPAALAAARVEAMRFLRTSYRGKELEERLGRLRELLAIREDLEEATVAAAAKDRPILWIRCAKELEPPGASAALDLFGVSLADSRVLTLLIDEFVVGFEAPLGSDAGDLADSSRRGAAARARTNGAGGREIQLLVLAPDHRVLLALPGFWHPLDLERELSLSLQAYRLWRDRSRTRQEKEAMLSALHASFLARLPIDFLARGDWSESDRRAELQRLEQGERRDTAEPVYLDLPLRGWKGRYVLKPVCRVVHERMLAQPLAPLEELDLAALTDYGQERAQDSGRIRRGRDRGP
ncbi:MAG: hypothetical protein Fur0037_03250 [Planctomycetota bacterium]